MSEFRTYAIILAAGRGERMQADQNKMQLKIAGKSLLELCQERFRKNKDIDFIFTVVPPDEMHPGLEGSVAGGRTRQDSVYNALKVIEQHAEGYNGRVLVLIHDGARCFVPSTVLERVLSLLKSERSAVVAVLPVADTIRQSKELVLRDLEVPRHELLQMQTPQAADLDILLHAFDLARREDVQVTDDISLLLRIGYPVRVVSGDRRNLKLTTPADLEIAHMLYESGYFDE